MCGYTVSKSAVASGSICVLWHDSTKQSRKCATGNMESTTIMSAQTPPFSAELYKNMLLSVSMILSYDKITPKPLNESNNIHGWHLPALLYIN